MLRNSMLLEPIRATFEALSWKNMKSLKKITLPVQEEILKTASENPI